jgi:hypothetical protein
MCARVQHTHSREVFGCGPVECMGAGYSHADRKLSTRVHGCGVRARQTKSYRRRYNLESHGKRVGKSVNRRIIISYNAYPWGIQWLEASGDAWGCT